MASIVRPLLDLYRFAVRGWESKHPALRAAALQLSNAWDGIDVKKVPVGQKVGCGGQADYVTKQLWAHDGGWSKFFYLETLSGYDSRPVISAAAGFEWRAHCVTCVLATVDPFAKSQAAKSLDYAKRQFRIRSGLVLDTWHKNVNAVHNVYPLKSFLEGGLDLWHGSLGMHWDDRLNMNKIIGDGDPANVE